jgi:hypothetical protein
VRNGGCGGAKGVKPPLQRGSVRFEGGRVVKQGVQEIPPESSGGKLWEVSQEGNRIARPEDQAVDILGKKRDQGTLVRAEGIGHLA